MLILCSFGKQFNLFVKNSGCIMEIPNNLYLYIESIFMILFYNFVVFVSFSIIV